MANSKLLKEAIADAKAVRETALANAKIALEEAFTPRLQSILSKKLREEEGKEAELDEELDSSDIGSGTEDKPKDPQGFDADTDLSVGVEKSSDAVGAELDDYEKVADLNEDEETPKQENLSVAKLRERLQRRLAELEDTTEGEDQTNEDESEPKSEYGMGEDEPTTESDELELEIEDGEDYDVTGNEEEDTEEEMDLEAIIRELEAAAEEPKNESLADGEEAGTDKGEDPKVVITTERARILRRLSMLNEEEVEDMKKEEEANEEEEKPTTERRKIAERRRLAERNRLLRRLAEVEDEAQAQNEDESEPKSEYGMGEDEPTTESEYGMGEDEPTVKAERRKLRERKQLLRRLAELESDEKMENEDPTGATLEPTTEGEDDVIDLNEILREMEADLKQTESEDMTSEEDEPAKEPAAESRKIKEMKRNLKEAYSTIVSLRNTINEVNLLNAKLLFANKLFRAHNLTNEQKVKVIETLDRTKSVREVKLVYSTLAENLRVGFSNKGAKKSITEGFASKVVKSTKPTKRVISEGSDFSARFKKLAGIIK